MRKTQGRSFAVPRSIAGTAILLSLYSGVLAVQATFSAYLEACALLQKGEPRAECARRFAAVASRQPNDRFAELSASLAEHLKQMAVEDQAFQSPVNPAALAGQPHIDSLIFKLR